MKRSRDGLTGSTNHFGKVQAKKRRKTIRSSSVQARLTAWAHYSYLVGKYNDSKKALKEALKRAFQMDQRGEIDKQKEFARWDKHNLWPPPELEDTPYGETPLFQDTGEKD